MIYNNLLHLNQNKPIRPDNKYQDLIISASVQLLKHMKCINNIDKSKYIVIFIFIEVHLKSKSDIKKKINKLLQNNTEIISANK